MVTHKPEDLEYMESVIFMAEGGQMAYYGDASRDSYLKYFNVKNAPKIYSNLVDKNAEYWVRKYKQLNPKNPNTNSRPQPIKSSQPTNYFSQYYWLTNRYFNIKLNDKVNSAVMVGQAPIIAILISIIFSSIGLPVPFLLTISALWFGVNNAAREIVAELPIYKRERMFNQGILPYILSKLTVLTTFAAIQCFIFTLFMYLRYNSCSNDNSCVTWNNPQQTFLWMLFISIVSTLMGLMLSAIVASTEKVMTLVPIVLIPQLMLAGIITKIDSKIVEMISYLTISRWGTEGFSNIQKFVIVESQKPDTTVNKLKPVSSKENAIDYLKNLYHSSYEKTFGSLTGKLQLDFYALACIGVILFITLYIALRKKDPLKIN
jgi:ABC-type multidrug transport system permease subunit